MWLAAGVGLVAIMLGGWYGWQLRDTAADDVGTVPSAVPAPTATGGDDAPAAGAPGRRVVVEVLNASGVRGLGRRATAYLRDRGLDVVLTANAPDTLARDSSLVLDRVGDAAAAARVAKALGGARVESRPDSSRYVHVTVLLGRTWRPPANTLYP